MALLKFEEENKGYEEVIINNIKKTDGERRNWHFIK
jgi:hypothetical protein